MEVLFFLCLLMLETYLHTKTKPLTACAVADGLSEQRPEAMIWTQDLLAKFFRNPELCIKCKSNIEKMLYRLIKITDK